MIKHPLSPKNLKKVSNINNTKSFKKTPDNFPDFCKLIKIRSGNKIVNFELFEYQKILSELIDENYATIVVKSRQLGLTQLVTAKFLYKAIKNNAYVALVLSKGQSDTSLIAHRMREMINSLDEYFELENDNLSSIRIRNGGVIHFKNSKPDATRGVDSVSDILFDESAFVDNIDLIYTSAIPTLEMCGKDARIIVLSTPNGMSGWYYDKVMSDNPIYKNPLDICDQIRNGLIAPLQYWIDESKWVKFFVHWRSHPTYSQNPNYLDEIATNKKLPLSQVKQEYDLSFTDSSDLVFDPIMVRKICSIKEYSREKREKVDYYIGIDTANMGADYFVMTVIEHDYLNNIFKLVDVYRKRKMSSEYHLFQILEYIDKYSPDKVAIEVTGGTGLMYLEQLISIKRDVEFVPIKTTQDSKQMMVDKLLLNLEKGLLELVNDKVLINELLSFQKIGKKLSAIEGKHDDFIMSLCFCNSILPTLEIRKLIDFSNAKILN